MLESGVLVDLNEQPIYWHLPSDRTGGSLPDSSLLWNVIWENRHLVMGFAHSHPGFGIPGPSHTDLTTFRAIEQALGTNLLWWITSRDKLVSCVWQSKSLKYRVDEDDCTGYTWLNKLREHSNYGE